ncbi:MAG TPA: MFS transporter [Acidimicrobiales bacterium]|nr:MFS transporter [Acidimicrobiales bacterium]
MPELPDAVHKPIDKLEEIAGGPARARVIVLLAAVMALESADAGTVGAVAAQLERAFHIGNTRFGLLPTVTSLVGALASLPMGVLADRARRTRVLQVTVLLWAVAMAATGIAWSYMVMLMTRLALGVVIAAAGPIVASLTGDLFPARERSRMYGFILTGELLGAGAGLVISADLASFAGWRSAFFFLAVPSLALAFALRRLLPEPARGGQSWLRPGDEEIKTKEEVQSEEPPGHPGQVAPPPDLVGGEVRTEARKLKGVEARPGLVLRQDPLRMRAWAAAAYILRIPSNLVLIGSSVLGYFFLAGLRSFAVLFTEAHYQVSQAVVTLIFIPIGVGSVVGTIWGGRLVDTMIKRHRVDARVLVAGFCFIGAAVAFAPGLWSTLLWVSLPLYTVAAAFLTGLNPALDAARLDVVPSRLWGRGEAVRTFAQQLLEAFAPLLFGYVSGLFGGPGASLGSSMSLHGQKGRVPPAVGTGLEYTFMIMLVPLLASGLVLLFNRRAYLVDVATADVSDQKRWDGGGRVRRSREASS